MKHFILTISACLCLVTFTACSSDSESDLVDNQDPPGNNDGPVTYNAQVKPIIDNNCVSCHNSPPVNGAPFALVNYEQVKAIAQSGALMRSVSKQTGEAGAMPPSGRLPQATIDLLQEWIDDGLLED